MCTPIKEEYITDPESFTTICYNCGKDFIFPTKVYKSCPSCGDVYLGKCCEGVDEDDDEYYCVECCYLAWRHLDYSVAENND